MGLQVDQLRAANAHLDASNTQYHERALAAETKQIQEKAELEGLVSENMELLARLQATSRDSEQSIDKVPKHAHRL